MNIFSILLMIYTRFKTYVMIFINKSLLNNINPHLYISVYSLLTFLISSTLMMINRKNIDFNELYKDKIPASIMTNVILGLTGFHIFLYLLNNNEISEWKTIGTGINIILAIIFGYYILNESMDTQKIIGVLVITLGVLIIYTNA